MGDLEVVDEVVVVEVASGGQWWLLTFKTNII